MTISNVVNPYRFAAAVISPSDISGLKGWYKADGTLWQDSARTTPASADGDPVGSWDDASGGGVHAKQATALNKPTLKTNIVNGRSVIRFDGTTDFLETSAPWSTVVDNYTMVLVIDPSATGSAVAPFYNGSGNSNGYGISTTTSGTIKKGQLRGGVAWDSTTSAADTALGLYILERAGGTTTLYVDGSALSPTFAGAPNAPTAASFIGNHYSGVGNNFTGDVCEAMFYEAALTAQNRTDLRSYVQSRWGTP